MVVERLGWMRDCTDASTFRLGFACAQRTRSRSVIEVIERSCKENSDLLIILLLQLFGWTI